MGVCSLNSEETHVLKSRSQAEAGGDTAGQTSGGAEWREPGGPLHDFGFHSV